MQKMLFEELKQALWGYYDTGSRNLSWRKSITPYKVVVSEIMLQQTQVSRVEQYFAKWMRDFPSWKALAGASRKDVLGHWQGLGYNRRALYLHRTACIVSNQYGGRLPRESSELVALPGIGPYTSGAIRAFAFNILDIFLETNIRTVLIHHFFEAEADQKIEEKTLLTILQSYIEYDVRAREDPREFYYALMDYGAYLKKEVGNLNIKSARYNKQSRFEGSRRQLRAGILRYILENGPVLETKIVFQSKRTKEEVGELLRELEKEGSVSKTKQGYKV
ncbi:MAG: A/G-specific adenine glycosylase [Patescibacteria group bacterium]